MINLKAENKTTIVIQKDLRDDLMRIKISTRAKNLNDVIAKHIKGLVPENQVTPIAHNNNKEVTQ